MTGHRHPAALSKRLRRLWFGLQTLCGGRPRGVFIPYRYADTLPGPGPGRAYPALEAWFAAAESTMAAALSDLETWRAELAAIGSDARPAGRGEPVPGIRWSQDWFPRLDAAIAYRMLRHFRPERLVEVGSGHSTRFLIQAIRDGGLPTRVTAIDPAPRAGLAAIAGPPGPLTLVRSVVQQADSAPFRALTPGDVLSIDSSHLLLPGSDVDLLLGRVLPSLPAGVLLHVHDILLPDDYPADWAWRGYNEQQAVAAMLAGGGFDLLFASHYAVTRMAPAVAGSMAGMLPLIDGARDTSLWLRKTSPALVRPEGNASVSATERRTHGPGPQEPAPGPRAQAMLRPEPE